MPTAEIATPMAQAGLAQEKYCGET